MKVRPAPTTASTQRDMFSIPGEIAADYRKEAARLGCDHRALYRAALKKMAGDFPLKKELVLA
jgi:hypothetical protein